ncbi:MAG TPA: RIO1 family regulatory kinase/ATPase, partial [Thermoplasmata archaeon]|nr:RIO1 family regulatory kinase/ATPase [Thermoplasmata archaeon]
MPNFPPLDASVQWKIKSGAIRFQESGYRATVEEILSSGLATEVVGLISAGKEADVYLARLGGAPLVVKVYRLYRTSHRHGGPIKVDNMAVRAAFEFEMLRQAWKGGAAVPTPAKRVENLLAMRYLGGEDGPAPRLIDLAPADPEAFLRELLAAVESLVLSGVVHG